MAEIIDMGSLKLRFLQTKESTGGRLDMFEMTLQPAARMPVPHYHESWDEAIYGINGTTTWKIDGSDVEVGSGDSIFIKRGVVHGFANRSAGPATCLCILSPGALGPQYFKEMAALIASGTPDFTKMKEVMLRYGLVPVPPT